MKTLWNYFLVLLEVLLAFLIGYAIAMFLVGLTAWNVKSVFVSDGRQFIYWIMGILSMMVYICAKEDEVL